MKSAKKTSRKKAARTAADKGKQLGKRDLHLSLLSALRRLMDTSDVSPRDRAATIAAMAKTTRQSAHRWLTEEGTGVPDLVSFKALVEALGADANYLLGLAGSPDEAGDAGPLDEVDSFAARVRSASATATYFTMTGDEMAPTVPKGALVVAEAGADKVDGSGMYALEHKGARTVRLIEQRFGKGLTLKCENRSYGEIQISNGDLEKSGLKLIGKVVAVAHLTAF